jgi:hypothetical protein
MTADEAIAAVKLAASGRTRFEGDEPWRDEILVAEIERLQGIESDYLRRHKDACDRYEDVIRLRSLNAEMVEALDAMVGAWDLSGEEGLYRRIWDNAIAVLAKARG